MDKRRVIVTGGKGQLGVDMGICLRKQGWEVYSFGKEELDITESGQVDWLFRKIRPHAVVHGGAYTKVDQAESDLKTAFQVNAFGSRNIASAAERENAKLVYVSTDYVFNGESRNPYQVHDETDPINVYGQTKLAGEQFARKLNSRHFIVRTSWVFGAHGGNFVRTMLRLAEEKPSLAVVADQTGSPTYTADLADCIANMLQTNRYGMYHVSNSGSCTWYEFAKAIFHKAGIDIPVSPLTTDQFPTAARRPAYSVFNHEELIRRGFPPMRSWQEALTDFLWEEGRLSGTEPGLEALTSMESYPEKGREGA